MGIEIEINEDLLEWIINSLYSNADINDLEQIEIIEYLESKQNED